ncbi:Uncharacterised protein [Avibacterium paragallinarum]|uniref:Transposase n=1 Tax=Avibacterium paragallinarum TaxID=728 RepID=A0A380Z8F7_AVIPA|nr:Uncharacterised protein [Avibacterium paragallinarum]
MTKYTQRFKQQVLDFIIKMEKTVRLLASIFSFPKAR